MQLAEPFTTASPFAVTGAPMTLAILPGSTVAWTPRKLSLLSENPPPPQAALEINSTRAFEGELVSF